MERKIAIIGCGGVGSNLAYLLTKLSPKPEKIVLIDYDKVDKGNQERQLFTTQDIGKNKAKALVTTLMQLQPDILYEAYDKKIETPEDMEIFSDCRTVCVCTDNMQSKRLINDNCTANKYFAGCEENYFEIKTELSKKDKSIWALESGYNSLQTPLSNLSASFFIYWLIQKCEGQQIKDKEISTDFVKKLIEPEIKIIFLGADINDKTGKFSSEHTYFVIEDGRKIIYSVPLKDIKTKFNSLEESKKIVEFLKTPKGKQLLAESGRFFEEAGHHD